MAGLPLPKLPLGSSLAQPSKLSPFIDGVIQAGEELYHQQTGIRGQAQMGAGVCGGESGGDGKKEGGGWGQRACGPVNWLSAVTVLSDVGAQEN